MLVLVGASRDAGAFAKLGAKRMKYAQVLVVLALVMPFSVRAAQLNGATLPDTERVGGTELHLNGFGLRSYSVFQVPIYVAGLYLRHPSSDADQILHSPDTRILEVHFVHDVSAEQARKAWREGFERNCSAPCHLAPQEIERFLAAVPAMRKGDSFNLLFTARGAEITVNGEPIGSITDPQFAREMLATFLGPQPASPRLKQELLGSHE